MGKREVNFFRERRGGKAAQDIVKFFRDLGVSDEDIARIMKGEKPSWKVTTPPALDATGGAVGGGSTDLSKT